MAFTDYGLALECGLFVYLLSRLKEQDDVLTRGFLLFFAGIALSAVAGGTLHGFFLGEPSLGHRLLWKITLLSIGATTFAAWVIGARIALAKATARWVLAGAVLQLVAYSLMVLFMTPIFVFAIMNYLPAALFLFGVYIHWYIRVRDQTVLIGLLGFVLTFVAAWVQQSGVDLHPRYFNHNALYHLFQAIALYMIFLSGQWFLKSIDHSPQ